MTAPSMAKPALPLPIADAIYHYAAAYGVAKRSNAVRDADIANKRYEELVDLIREAIQPPDTVPARIVRRPTSPTSTIPTPKEVGISGDNLWIESVSGHKDTGGWPCLTDRIARWSADGITWYSRTTETRAKWTAADVPEGDVFFYGPNGNKTVQFSNASRQAVANCANLDNAQWLLLLPTEMEIK